MPQPRRWDTIADDMGVSLLVILTGLRLLGQSRGSGIDEGSETPVR